MNFEEKIEYLEKEIDDNIYITKNGTIPILLTAPHTMRQFKEDGTFKYEESFTKAIAKYVSIKTDCCYLIKTKDTKVDSNKDNKDGFKLILNNLIKENNIKLVIDLHGAKKERDFDVEFGTLNNLSADFSTIKELEDSFLENGVTNIVYNNPFKGGGITKYIYGKTDIDVIQIEINGKFRDLNNPENIEKICNSLIQFIKQYYNVIGGKNENL